MLKGPSSIGYRLALITKPLSLMIAQIEGDLIRPPNMERLPIFKNKPGGTSAHSPPWVSECVSVCVCVCVHAWTRGRNCVVRRARVCVLYASHPVEVNGFVRGVELEVDDVGTEGVKQGPRNAKLQPS